mmetsp:Transcript_111374/g.311255  ORF Transcript_111374/g.311255 Transcript_111374/m.311255 type:complete len:240 (+) Transcript_111374:904-1623(+)
MSSCRRSWRRKRSCRSGRSPTRGARKRAQKTLESLPRCRSGSTRSMQGRRTQGRGRCWRACSSPRICRTLPWPPCPVVGAFVPPSPQRCSSVRRSSCSTSPQTTSTWRPCCGWRTTCRATRTRSSWSPTTAPSSTRSSRTSSLWRTSSSRPIRVTTTHTRRRRKSCSPTRSRSTSGSSRSGSTCRTSSTSSGTTPSGPPSCSPGSRRSRSWRWRRRRSRSTPSPSRSPSRARSPLPAAP